MGISRGAIKLIAMALKDRTPGGTVLTFGVQSIDGGRSDVIAAMKRANNGSNIAAPDAVRAVAPSADKRLHQSELFSMLGVCGDRKPRLLRRRESDAYRRLELPAASCAQGPL